MEILVIGGVHGNEPLGLEIVKLFKTKPQKNVDVVLANVPAIKANKRFIRTDLNRSFPGNVESRGYESKRAAQLLELCGKYDVVLDFHNTHCPDNDCSFVGERALPIMFKSTSWLDLKRVIVADYECINKYAPNCLSVEVSLDSARNNAGLWYELISKLARNNKLPAAEQIEKFKFQYRITLEDKKIFALEKQKLKAFEPIDVDLASKMGVPAPAYPIFIGDNYTPYNYGGLLNKMNV